MADFQFHQRLDDELDLTFRLNGSDSLEITVFNVASEPMFAYELLIDAVARFPNASGYLYVNDDVFLNWWTVQRFDQRRLWFNAIPRRMSPEFVATWPHMRRPTGLAAHVAAVRSLPSAFRRQLAKNLRSSGAAGGDGRADVPAPVQAVADAFYVPQRLARDFAQLAAHFRHHNVFLELAVPDVMLSLVRSRKEIEPLDGLYLWGNDRNLTVIERVYKYGAVRAITTVQRFAAVRLRALFIRSKCRRRLRVP